MIQTDFNLHSVQSALPIDQEGDIPSVLGTVGSTEYRLGINKIKDRINLLRNLDELYSL